MRIAAAFALLALASCSGDIDPATAKAEVEQLVKVYHEAYDRGDVAGVIALLDPEVTIPNPPSSFFRGVESCGAELKKGMDRIRDLGKVGKRMTYLGELKVVVEGRIAVATYQAHVSEEGSTPSKSIFTRIYRHNGKKWLILSEHYTFAPEK
jgi:ketosteroid isomerase-like protein